MAVAGMPRVIERLTGRLPLLEDLDLLSDVSSFGLLPPSMEAVGPELMSIEDDEARELIEYNDDDFETSAKSLILITSFQ